MPEVVEWVTLFHPEQHAYHRVPDHPAVIQDFQNRGWLTPEDSEERAKADAELLRGEELEDALKDAGLSRGGTVKEKQKRLADFRADQTHSEQVEPTDPHDPLTESTTTPEDTEGEQVNG
jgi:hypothetical protein